LFSGIAVFSALFGRKIWIFPFAVASLFLILALLVHTFKEVGLIAERINIFKFLHILYCNVPYNQWVIKLIEEHEWLKEVFGQSES